MAAITTGNDNCGQILLNLSSSKPRRSGLILCWEYHPSFRQMINKLSWLYSRKAVKSVRLFRRHEMLQRKTTAQAGPGAQGPAIFNDCCVRITQNSRLIARKFSEFSTSWVCLQNNQAKLVSCLVCWYCPLFQCLSGLFGLPPPLLS